MRKPTANKIRDLLQRELGDKFTIIGYRRAKKMYNTLSWKVRHKVG